MIQEHRYLCRIYAFLDTQLDKALDMEIACECAKFKCMSQIMPVTTQVAIVQARKNSAMKHMIRQLRKNYKYNNNPR